jgi:hypothetical protein
VISTAKPGQQIDVVVFMAELDFSHDKTEVLAENTSTSQVRTRKLITPLLDGRPLPESD